MLWLNVDFITVTEHPPTTGPPLTVPPVPEVAVEVRVFGRGRVGTAYTLTCTVTLSHRVRDSSVSIQWQGPSIDDQPTVDSTDNRVITKQLSLHPLTLAHGGDYTCTAVYRVNGEDIISKGYTETLTIAGNHHSLSICTCNFPFSISTSCRASGPSETRRHHIHGCQVRQCPHPVDGSLHILLSRDICSTVWH